MCDSCYQDGYIDALEGRGVRMQEMQHGWRCGSNVTDIVAVEFTAALAYDFDIRATFAQEGIFSKLFGNRDEIQSGDDAPNEVKRLLGLVLHHFAQYARREGLPQRFGRFSAWHSRCRTCA